MITKSMAFAMLLNIKYQLRTRNAGNGANLLI